MTEQTTYTSQHRARCLTCGQKWPTSATPPNGAATHATVKGHTVQTTTVTVTTHTGATA